MRRLFNGTFFSACAIGFVAQSLFVSYDYFQYKTRTAVTIVHADRQILSAVVVNLLQNAFKFTRPQTTVMLRVNASADRVVLEIEDECGGLPDENVEDLFRTFEQRHTIRTGLGLGLAFSRWGAEVNGGRISVRSLPDRGCVFGVDLPRVAASFVEIV